MTSDFPVLSLINLGKAVPIEILTSVETLVARAGDGEAFLLVAEPTGEAIVLGRDQRAASALRPDHRMGILRRRSGGKGTLLGEGVLYVGLILPSLLYLHKDPFPPERTVNRYVRPILRALESFGVKAFYYGTDYLILNRKRGGYVSFDIGPGGEVLVETVIGFTRPWQIPSGWKGYPPQTLERPLEDTTLGDEAARAPSLEEFTTVLTEQFKTRYSARVRSAPAPRAEGRTSAENVKPPLPHSVPGQSSLRESAIGFIEATAALEGGRLSEVSIHGDFIANSPAIRDLQVGLEGVPAAFDSVDAIVNDLFARPENFVIGIRPLSLITEVVLEASEKFRKGEG